MKRLLFILMGIVLWTSIVLGQNDEGAGLKIPEMQSKKWALCIGVSNYSSLGKLAYSTKDCISFADTLKSDLGFSNDSVFVMADKEGFETPTADNVKKKIDEILSKSALDSGDLFIIYFSGHGMGLGDGDYWMPSDATAQNAHEKGIPITQVLARLTKKQLRNVVVISDACRAGEKNPFGQSLIELSRKTNIGVLLGCAPGEKSYESPKLGQGAFTFFLNKAIKNKTAIDKSLGAMLLSSLGNNVAKGVEEYTKYEYGDNAQRPSIFAEKEQEVVLSTTVPGASEIATYLETYKKCLNIGQFSQEQYNDALTTLAYLLHQEKREDEALAVIRVLQSYGNLRSAALYVYVLICKDRNASYELNSALQKNSNDDPNSLMDDLAMLHGGTNAVGRIRFLQAVWNLYNSDSRDQFLPCFEPFLQKANAGVAEKAKLFDRLAQDYSQNKLVSAYAAFLKLSIAPGNLSLDAALKAVRDLDTEKVFADSCFRIQYRANLSRRDYAKAAETITLARESLPSSSYWEMRSLIVSALLRDPDLVKKAKLLLEKSSNGDTILSLLTILRRESILLESDFKAAADRLSGNLEAQVAYWVVLNLKNLKDIKSVPESLDKLARGHYRASLIAYREMNDLIGMGYEAGWIPSSEAVKARTIMANDLSTEFNEIGDDPDAVLLLAKLLNGTNQSYRLVMLGMVGPWAEIETRLLSRKSEFLKQFYLAELNNGFVSDATKTFEKLDKMGEVDAEILIRASIDAIFDHNLPKATDLLERLTKHVLSPSQSGFQKLITAYLACEKGDTKAITHLREDMKANSLDMNGLFYLEFICYIASNQDIPNLSLTKALTEEQPFMHDVWSVGVFNVYRRCLESKSPDASRFIDYLPRWATSEPMNVNFLLFGYNVKPDVSQYIGHYEFTGILAVNHVAYNGTFVVDVDEKGILSGIIKLDGEAETIIVKGPINGFGRGFFDVLIGDKENIGALALVPHKQYQAWKSDELPTIQMILYSTSPFRMGFEVTGKREK